MRAITAAVTAAISGGILTITYAAIEVTAITVGHPMPDAIRTWAATLIALSTLGPLGLAILCRQRSILDELGAIHDFMLTSDAGQAARDYNDIRRQLGGDDGGSVTRIHPKE